MASMDDKMTLLVEGDLTFDPTSHPRVQELAQILTKGSEAVCEGGEEGMDEDVLVGKVSGPLTAIYAGLACDICRCKSP